MHWSWVIICRAKLLICDLRLHVFAPLFGPGCATGIVRSPSTNRLYHRSLTISSGWLQDQTTGGTTRRPARREQYLRLVATIPAIGCTANRQSPQSVTPLILRLLARSFPHCHYLRSIVSTLRLHARLIAGRLTTNHKDIRSQKLIIWQL